MFVTLVNKPEVEQALVAWKNSRPTEQDADYNRMIDLDLPVNEFTRVNLFIESTLIEREIIATMRNHVMWAQGSRVQDCLKFEIDYITNPCLQKNKSWYEDTRNLMRDLKNKGEPQDNYRLLLPIISNTRYSISTDFRSVVKLSKYFLHLASELPHLATQFLRFSTQLSAVCTEILDSAGVSDLKHVFSKYKRFGFLHEGYVDPDVSGRLGSIISVSATIPFHLRAHVIRHRGIHVKDDLLLMLSSKGIEVTSMEAMMNVQITGSVNELSEVVSKRSCWIANYKVWSDLLKKIEDNIPGHINPLPCKDGSCPWNADAMLRYEGNDPNPPCPIHLKLSGLKPDVMQVSRMHDMIAVDDRSEIFWKPKVKESLS